MLLQLVDTAEELTLKQDNSNFEHGQTEALHNGIKMEICQKYPTNELSG